MFTHTHTTCSLLHCLHVDCIDHELQLHHCFIMLLIQILCTVLTMSSSQWALSAVKVLDIQTSDAQKKKVFAIVFHVLEFTIL